MSDRFAGVALALAAIPQLERFAYIGVYSSGLLGAFPSADTGGAAPAPAPPPASPPLTATEWEKMNAAKLDDAALKKGLRLLVFKESPGGHTWINWRNYLVEFAPQLFQNGKGTF